MLTLFSFFFFCFCIYLVLALLFICIIYFLSVEVWDPKLTNPKFSDRQIEYSSDWSRIIRGNKRFNPDNTNSYKTQCDGN